MTNEETIIVLQNIKVIGGLCRTEKEALDKAIEILKNTEKEEN